MNFFNFPKNWGIDKNIPKEAIYNAINADTKMKELISNNIKRSRIKYILNKGTTNIEQLEVIDEINILTVELKELGREEKIEKIFHSLFPRAIILVFQYEDKIMLSTARKSIDKVVKIEKIYNTSWFVVEEQDKFIKSLDMKGYNSMNLKTFYGSIVDKIKAFKVFGSALKSKDIETEKLDELIRLKEELEEIKIKMKKENQLNRRVELAKKMKLLKEEINKK